MLPLLRLHLLLPSPLLRLVSTPLWPQPQLPQHTTVDTMVATTHTLVSVLTHMLVTLLTHMLVTMLTHTTTKSSRYIQTHHHRPTTTRGHYQGLSNLVPSLLPCTKRYKKRSSF